MTRHELAVAGFIAIILWSVLIFDSLCYGQGWCRWANDEMVETEIWTGGTVKTY